MQVLCEFPAQQGVIGVHGKSFWKNGEFAEHACIYVVHGQCVAVYRVTVSPFESLRGRLVITQKPVYSCAHYNLYRTVSSCMPNPLEFCVQSKNHCVFWIHDVAQ